MKRAKAMANRISAAAQRAGGLKPVKKSAKGCEKVRIDNLIAQVIAEEFPGMPIPKHLPNETRNRRRALLKNAREHPGLRT